VALYGSLLWLECGHHFDRTDKVRACELGGRLELAGRRPFRALHEAVVGRLCEVVGVIRDELGCREHQQIEHGAVAVPKKKHAVAIAEGGRTGEVRFLGEVENAPPPIERMIKRLAERCDRLL
jgi:hypothetical protein